MIIKFSTEHNLLLFLKDLKECAKPSVKGGHECLRIFVGINHNPRSLISEQLMGLTKF